MEEEREKEREKERPNVCITCINTNLSKCHLGQTILPLTSLFMSLPAGGMSVPMTSSRNELCLSC